jgi:3-hydroxymyristoyl/3-hydroxydecanoyl-(acyl carrier protein) dehydratase
MTPRARRPSAGAPRAFATLRVGPRTARAHVRPGHARRLAAGHFPDEPLLPGAYLAELMADLGARLAGAPVAEVVRCTFRRRVRPADAIVIAARLAAGGEVEAEVRVGRHAAARATLRFREAP